MVRLRFKLVAGLDAGGMECKMGYTEFACVLGSVGWKRAWSSDSALISMVSLLISNAQRFSV